MYFPESHFFATFFPQSPPFLAMLCAYVDVAPNGSSSFSSPPPNPHFLAPRSEGGGGGTAIKQGGERKKAADAPPFFLRWGKRRRSRREQHRKIIFPLSLSLDVVGECKRRRRRRSFCRVSDFAAPRVGGRTKGGRTLILLCLVAHYVFRTCSKGEGGMRRGEEVTSAAFFFWGEVEGKKDI